MNLSDDDLNCVLKTWTAARAPASLDKRLRRAYRDRARSRTAAALMEASPLVWDAAEGQRKRNPGAWVHWVAGFVPIAGKFAGFVAGAVILLAVIARAFPQSLANIAPPGSITIDSEFRDYKNDGSSSVSEYRTSSISSIDGETILSSSFPGDPFRTAAAEVLNPVKAILIPILERIGRKRDTSALAFAVAARIRNGCAPTNMWGRPMTVIGEEPVLNYTTLVSQFTPEGGNVRFTEWFAPGLDCISLRSTTDKTFPDGTFQLFSERRVLKVTSRTSLKESNR